jgi:hypothetical protein
MARAQCPFEAFPGKRLEQDPAGVENEIAAVRPVQRARFDMGEVSAKRLKPSRRMPMPN